jgi:S-phase kinase-associated protein 1
MSNNNDDDVDMNAESDDSYSYSDDDDSDHDDDDDNTTAPPQYKSTKVPWQECPEQVVLVTGDGIETAVNRCLVADSLPTVQALLDDLGNSGEPIPIPNVASAETLRTKIIPFCKAHYHDKPDDNKDDDDEATTNIDEPCSADLALFNFDGNHEKRFDFLEEAWYLGNKKMVHVMAHIIGKAQKGILTGEALAALYGWDPLTPEELAQFEREHWDWEYYFPKDTFQRRPKNWVDRAHN